MSHDFRHVHLAGDPHLPALLLLHGTGGDERDLVELGQAVAPGSTLLSVRGRVLENGMPRFFRRLSEGIFDLEDLALQTQALDAFLTEARQRYAITQPLYALGFSNGANIAASLLLSRPASLDGAILLRAMVPFEPDGRPDLSGKKVLMLSGSLDPIVPVETARRLQDMLAKAGADVAFSAKPAGHGLTQSDVSEMRSWMQSLIPRR